MRVSILLILAAIGVAGCRPATAPSTAGDAANFRIVLDKPEFTQREASEYGIVGTVTNQSDRDFYLNAGDAYNGALEQDEIFAVLGTDAVIERRVSVSRWRDASAGGLIEGFRFVVLKAGTSYRLTGTIAPNAPGTYRIRLNYSGRNEDPSPTLPFHDYSATFIVR